MSLQTLTNSTPLESQRLRSSVLSPEGSIPVGPAQGKHQLSSSSSGGAVGSFYKQPSKPAQSQVAQLSSNPTSTNVVPAKKPAISVRGRCVPHTEDRFRVEVSYHAGLIAVFKSIPSKNYGKCLRCLLCCFAADMLLSEFCSEFSVLVTLEDHQKPLVYSHINHVTRHLQCDTYLLKVLWTWLDAVKLFSWVFLMIMHLASLTALRSHWMSYLKLQHEFNTLDQL